MTQTPHGVVPALHSALEWQMISPQLSSSSRSSAGMSVAATSLTTLGALDAGAVAAAWLVRTAPAVSNAPTTNVNTNGRFDMQHTPWLRGTDRVVGGCKRKTGPPGSNCANLLARKTAIHRANVPAAVRIGFSSRER